MFVIFIESALNQISNHYNQFVQIFSLRRHLRLMAGGDEHVIISFDLKNELFRHTAILAYKTDFDKCQRRQITHSVDTYRANHAWSLSSGGVALGYDGLALSARSIMLPATRTVAPARIT